MPTTKTIDNIEIEQIAIPEGRRDIDPAAVNKIIKSLESSDLLNPIQVRPEGGGYVLIAGRHRIEAFKQLGRPKIPAIILRLNDLAASRAELVENLCRKELTQAERTRAIQRHNELLEEERPRAIWGDSRLPEDEPSGTFPRWEKPRETKAASGTNERLVSELRNKGLSQTSAYRQAKIAKQVPADVLDFLERSPADNNTRTAEALSRLTYGEQRKAVAAVRSGKAETIREAIKVLKAASPVVATGSKSGVELGPELPGGDTFDDPDPPSAATEADRPRNSDDETMSAIEVKVRGQFEGRLAVGAARLETVAANIRNEL